MKSILFYSLILLMSTGCNKDNPLAGDWLIPINMVFDGGPGKDGIPALTDPRLTDAGSAAYLNDQDLILGFADGEDVRAYPHPILDWHEIINDDTDNHSLAVVYCPLTGTGIGWNRVLKGQKTTFGVSGLLFNSNVIPYDRLTDSNWSQLLLKSVNGELIGKEAKSYQLVETTWGTWKQMYPDTKVLSDNTGYSRTYGKYPYGSYKTNNNLLFPVTNTDSRLHIKERVLSIFINEKAKAYRFETFLDDINAIHDEFENTEIVVIGSKEKNFIVAFQRRLDDGTLLNFQSVTGELSVIIMDDEGTRWDIFGRAVDGLREGEKLTPVVQMMGYWFSFAAFYPGLRIYGN